jgi:hypothetical protein
VRRDIGINILLKLNMQGALNKMARIALDNNNRIYDHLKDLSAGKAEKARFIYSHFLMPHYPYYFYKDGREFPRSIMLEETSKSPKPYLEYLQWCNGRFLQLIDTILRNTQGKAIVVFMSDHGFRELLKLKNVDPKYLYSSINAVYLPGRDYRNYYDSMSNVNQFRVILNTSFGQHLLLLPDSAVFIK